MKLNEKDRLARMNRRSTLMFIGATVPAIAMISTTAKASKMSQTTAHYIAKSTNGKLCSGCKFFQSPHSCKVVEGNIDPNGYCILWQKA